MFQRRGDLPSEADYRIYRQTFRANALPQRLPLDVLHSDIDLAGVLADFVNGADMRMIERGGGARLLLEALENALVLGSLVGKKFQRHRAAESGVLGAVYHAHAAAAQLIEDAKMRKSLCQHGAAHGRRRGTRLMNDVPDRRCGNPLV